MNVAPEDSTDDEVVLLKSAGWNVHHRAAFVGRLCGPEYPAPNYEDLTSRDKQGLTPLQIATLVGDTEALSSAVAADDQAAPVSGWVMSNARLNLLWGPSSGFRRDPLAESFKQAHSLKRKGELLVHKPKLCELNPHVDANGNTLLHLAAFFGTTSFINKSSVTRTALARLNKSKFSPVTIAAIRRNLHTIDPKLIDHNLLTSEALRHRSFSVIQLATLGEELSHIDPKFLTEKTFLLPQECAEKHAGKYEDPGSNTPFHLALKFGGLDMIDQKLITARFLQSKPSNRETVVHLTVFYRGFPELVCRYGDRINRDSLLTTDQTGEGNAIKAMCNNPDAVEALARLTHPSITANDPELVKEVLQLEGGEAVLQVWRNRDKARCKRIRDLIESAPAKSQRTNLN